MQGELEEEVREFLIESNENLALLDQQIVELEKDPQNVALISSIFRTVHSIKGTCGFFGFDTLGAVAHLTESILVQLREKRRMLTPALISLILEAVDAVKALLLRIEATGSEGADATRELRARLEAAYRAEMTGPQVVAERATPVEDAADARPAVPQVMEKAAADTWAESQVSDSTIRVDVNLLNQLMTLAGELVLTRNQLLQAAGSFSPAVQQTSQRLNVITSELQEGVMKTRMQPIGVIWNKLPRVVRDLSSRCGKQIQIEMHGAETELDKSLIESIRDPLTHLVRNACDHGIELPAERERNGKPARGTLSLRAFHEAGAVNIEIQDDGAGIDPDRVRAKAVEKQLVTPEQAAAMSSAEAIQLIFLPGFSTAAQVTSLSGRGVGMDVVKTNIEKISGSVEIAAVPQGGTTIRLKIPLTLAIIPGLIVSCQIRPGPRPGSEDRFVLPQSHLVEMTRVNLEAEPCPVETVHGAVVFRHRGKLLPLIYLRELLQRGGGVQDGDNHINIIVLQAGGRHFGLVVDRICDTQEIVVKPLGQQLKHLPCYSGATIMGDGHPALILDVGGMARLAGLETAKQQCTVATAPARSSGVSAEMLVFRAGTHQRLGLPLSIVNRLEEFPVEALEDAAGQAVVSYRGELLPLFDVASFLDSGSLSVLPSSGRIKVVVINNGDPSFNGDRRIGLIVDEIIDIVEDVIEMMRTSPNTSFVGSAVLGGAVTDLLDVTVLQDRASRSWSRAKKEEGYRHRILFYDPWPLSREMTRLLLGSAGYLHRAVSGAAEVRSALNEGGVDVLMMAEGKGGAPGWWSAMRAQEPKLAGVPQIVLRETRADAGAADKHGDGDSIVVDRQDKAELLRAIFRLIHHGVRKRAA